MLRGLYRSRCEQIGGIASAVRGLALDEVVDLILLAHEDEFVVAMHDQFLEAVLELLAWGLEAHHPNPPSISEIHGQQRTNGASVFLASHGQPLGCFVAFHDEAVDFALAQLTQPFVWIRAGERAGLQE